MRLLSQASSVTASGASMHVSLLATSNACNHLFKTTGPSPLIPAPTCPCSHPERLFKQGVLGSGQKNYKVNTRAPFGISRCGGFCTFDCRRAASSLKWVSMKVSHAYKPVVYVLLPDVILNTASPSAAAPGLQRKMYRTFHPCTK